jgi:hypothetical protein
MENDMATRDDALRDRLDALCRQSNRDLIKEIQRFESRHHVRFGKEYGRFMEQYEMLYSSLVGLTHAINYYDKSSWPKHRALQFTLAAHAQKQLYSSYSLLQQGFYEDSISIIRNAYETFLRILFISCNQEYSWNVFSNKEGGPKFNATNFVKDELKLDWPTYNLMSAFAHSNKVDVLEDIIQITKEAQKKPISLTLKYDEERVGVAINYLQFLMLVFLKLLNEVFVADYSNHKEQEAIKAELDKAKEYADLWMQVMETHTSNPTWRVMAGDVKRIFELVHHMESDNSQPWRQVWAEISKHD